MNSAGPKGFQLPTESLRLSRRSGLGPTRGRYSGLQSIPNGRHGGRPSLIFRKGGSTSVWTGLAPSYSEREGPPPCGPVWHPRIPKGRVHLRVDRFGHPRGRPRRNVKSTTSGGATSTRLSDSGSAALAEPAMPSRGPDLFQPQAVAGVRPNLTPGNFQRVPSPTRYHFTRRRLPRRVNRFCSHLVPFLMRSIFNRSHPAVRAPRAPAAMPA